MPVDVGVLFDVAPKAAGLQLRLAQEDRAVAFEYVAPPTPTPTPDAPLAGAAAKGFLTIVNPSGNGLYLRPDPSTRNQIKDWPVGTRLVDLGLDVQADGITWRAVQDPAGNRGYIQADKLGPAS